MLHFELDGEPVELVVEPWTTLLDVLRIGLGRTASKQGCDKGDCGACTVLLNDQPVLACLTLALICEGSDVRTVQGLAGSEGLSPVQEAFVRLGAAQCGFCTPGMLMSATHLVEQHEGPEPPSRQEVAEALSGNLCRCTGYTKILDAVIEACESGARGGAAP